MLSYRHAFHAGNHADVLKHLLLTALLRYLNRKDKPYWYIDSHAGAGMYSLGGDYAQKNAEFSDGIARLWQRTDLPPLAADYVEQVRHCNPSDELRYYPGSPCIADLVLREQDKLRLFELHPADGQLLMQQFHSRGRRARIQAADGFDGLKVILPPPTRRALTLIDPPYEDKRDYRRVIQALNDCQQRFATGCYALWLPLLQRPESRELPEKLQRLPVNDWLYVAMQVRRPSADGFGMHGSALYIINPPYTLHDELATLMPWLTEILALDDGADYQLRRQTA